jgi:hypothetical protein
MFYRRLRKQPEPDSPGAEKVTQTPTPPPLLPHPIENGILKPKFSTSINQNKALRATGISGKHRFAPFAAQ